MRRLGGLFLIAGVLTVLAGSGSASANDLFSFTYSDLDGDFDAATVDPATVTLAGADVAVRGKSEKRLARLEDVDDDGDLDLLLQVDTQSYGAVWEAGPVDLEGFTYDGQEIVGTDDVIIVPPE